MRFNFFETSIRRKFTFGLSIITLLTMLFFSSALIFFNFASGKKQLNGKIDFLLHEAKMSLPSALWKYNQDYVDDYVDALFLNDDIVFIQVETGGTIIKKKQRSGDREKNANDYSEASGFFVRKGEVFYKNRQVGIVTIIMSLGRVKRHMVKESVSVIFIGIINIIAIFIATFFLSRKNIFKPLSALHDSVESISSGNLETVIDTGGRDEIAKLSYAFEKMMIHLKSTMSSKQELEKEILDRKVAQQQSSMISEILERSLNEIYIFDADSLYFIMVNQGARNNTGYSLKEFKRMTPVDIMSEMKEKRFSEMLSTLESGEKDVISYNTTHQRKDRSEYPVEVHLQLMLFHAKSLFVAIVIDITDRMISDRKLLESVREKDVLLREIHHRVKNNMQMIQSLLNLQMRKTKSSALKKAFQDSNSRIAAMALIHETLYRSSDLASLNMKVYFESVIKYLSKIYQDVDATVSVDADDIKLDIDRSISCGLILNELVTNAFKYAFTDREETCRINVGFKYCGENEVKLTVSDNGRGLPETVSLENIDSLGLKIVQMLAEDQLNGSLCVMREEALKYEIILPLH